MRWKTLVSGLILALFCSTGLALAADKAPLMTIDELNSRLADGDVLVVDVRSSKDWNKSDIKITGAKRLNKGEAWILEEKKSQPIAFYCA